jgi:hypothetical protein
MSKTDAGERLIPMNHETLEIVIRPRERAKGFSRTEPEHYVFPACEHGHVNATRNQKSFRTLGGGSQRPLASPDCVSMTFAIMKCGIAGFRPNHHGDCWPR